MDDKYNAIQFEINGLKQLLNATDYKCLKFAEGAITESEYAETKALRAEYRRKINALEAQLPS
jgi:hypothetical protein